MKTLKSLYAIHSPSKGEKRMRKYLRRYIKSVCPNIDMHSDNTGNMYITKGESDTYPCVVAHLDQVQDKHSGDFEVIQGSDMLIGFSKTSKRSEGLGADDKNGIWIALQCLKRFDVMKVAFFVGEEIGCVGSEDADMTFFDDCRFVLQCDRRGAYDLITNAGCVELCSDDFVKAVCPERFGYKETNGLMTDVMQLKENGLSVSAVNMSCGYYNPHTDNEFTIISDLLRCRDFVFSIIERCTDVYPHKYEPKYSGYDYGNYWGKGSKYSKYDWDYYDWGDYDTKKSKEIDKYEECAQDMAYELYRNPSATFHDFIDYGYLELYDLTEEELGIIYDDAVYRLGIGSYKSEYTGDIL